MTKDKNMSVIAHEAPPRPAPKASWASATDVAIIGRGFAGLSAALTLARSGCEVVFREKFNWKAPQLEMEALLVEILDCLPGTSQKISSRTSTNIH